jgi:spermidine/putrescine ABC transporter ATP-binding subunit
VSVVEIQAVNKHYGTVAALDDVSVTIGDGEFFALLGPSGSGKTTLLRAIAGFVTPQSGHILVDGEDIRDEPVHKRDIGMVFQHYALFPHMNVFDNVAFGLSVRRTDSAEVSRRVGDILQLVELGGFEQRIPSQLSGGQQQRVALARALITKPRVLLLDEPLGALDKRLRQQMQIELREIQREVGITTVFVTHDQEEALTLSDRIALLNDGRIIQIGPPAEVYERPRTHFAASFLGDANFFTGRADGEHDGFGRISADTGSLYTADTMPAHGTALTIAVRPEKLRVTRSSDDNDQLNCLSGQVVQSVYGGSSITYKVNCGEHVVTVFEQNREARPAASGEAVTLSWSPEHSIIVEA